MIVDMHAHFFAKENLEKVDRKYSKFAPRLLTDARGRYWIVTNGRQSGPSEPMKEFYDIEARVRSMDKTGVDLQVLSVTPGNFLYEAPIDAGKILASTQNDSIAEHVEANPEKFIGCATVPMQDVDGAVEELDRTVKDLGFTSVEIGTNVNGKSLDSLEFWPFYEKVEELEIPIIVHPINNVGAERMGKFYLSNIVGNPTETTLAIGNVIFGGVLEQFSSLRFCWAHGGGFFPYQVGRFDHGYRVRSEPKAFIKRNPSEYVKSMFFDTVIHSGKALGFLVDSMGYERVLYGTDFPWDMGEYDSIDVIKTLDFINEAKKLEILGGNSLDLFKISTG